MFNVGDVYEQLGERDSALVWMEKVLKGGYKLVKFKQNPGLQDLIADERFKNIVRSIELDNMKLDKK